MVVVFNENTIFALFNKFKMSEKQNKQQSELAVEFGKTGAFIQENKKSLLVIASTVLGLLVLFFAYQKFYLAPRTARIATRGVPILSNLKGRAMETNSAISDSIGRSIVCTSPCA